MSSEEVQNNNDKGNIRIYCGKEYDITNPKYAGLSKNALKKKLKDEIWEETREQRVKGKKEKIKKRKRERKKLVEEGILEPLPKRSRNKDITVGNVGVVLDCAFSSLMIDKEMNSLRQQLARSYSANVRAEKESMKMTMTSVDDILTKEMDSKAASWRNWKNLEITSEPYIERFNKDDLVYLTADSDNVIHELEEGKTYIVGAIVDKNRYKNLCKNKADEQGIKTARLPIGDYIRLFSRKVLTINHVLEIMVKWLDCHDWKEAFMKVIPERKLKESELVNQDEDEETESGEEEEQLSEKQEKEIIKEDGCK